MANATHTPATTLAKKSADAEFFKLRQLISGQLGTWALALLLGMVTVIATVGLLMLSGWFISAAALAGFAALGLHLFNYLMPSAMIRAFAIVRTAGRYGELMVAHQAIFRLLQDLRVRFFNQFAKLLPRQLPADLRSAHTMHRLTHDIDVLDEFVLRVVSPWLQAIVVVTILSTLIGLWLPIATGLKFTLIVVFIIVGLVIPLIVSIRGISQADTQHTLAEHRRVSLLEPMTALTHLLMWQRWDSEIAKFIRQDKAYQASQTQAQRTRGIAMLAVQWGVAVLLVLMLYWLGMGDAVNVPLALAAVLGLLGVGEIVVPLASNYLALGNSLAAKNRLNHLLTAQDSHQPTINLEQLIANNQPLQLQVHDLTGKMPNAVVGFSHISFDVKQGKPLLITGASGAGKSTLLQVLAGEIVPQSGSITLNGKDWQAIDWQGQNGSRLGYLGQQIDIFDQTLAQNLRLGKATASDDELWQALDDVGLKTWAMSQPQGLDTPLGEYGMAVSGGQARRIALARLLLTPKKLLMLDEPFAGLDEANRERVWQRLCQRQKDGLLIVVTHQVWQSPDSVDRLRLNEPAVVA